MLSFLVVLLLSDANADNACISGRINDANLNAGLNGLYSDDGEYNGNPSYSKTTDCQYLSQVYLYFTSNQWRIAETKGASSWIASCTQTSIDDCTAGQWNVAEQGGSFVTDSSMYSRSGECPSVCTKSTYLHTQSISIYNTYQHIFFSGHVRRLHQLLKQEMQIVNHLILKLQQIHIKTLIIIIGITIWYFKLGSALMATHTVIIHRALYNLMQQQVQDGLNQFLEVL